MRESDWSSDVCSSDLEYTNGGTVELELVSVQKDLKIKFTNKKSGKLISNVPFMHRRRKQMGGGFRG